ncbi:MULTISPECIES: glycosyltransferase family 2 protein [Chloracidobacterium]|jgi:glycosyltransferase involved in cell wall biosynthesis|uniref:glycosyltransferase family 2 protein n=1 Tax=Chloracidobacterium TaxID=458032 RepID=UPI0007389CB2|nr:MULTISPECIES: glycosyltransferase family 2 protein [Chloracidobacterium]QUV87789.1 glycosyltransferase family 2 protein [Chloracidobacterium sp. S]QUV90689.1 glycosyltransferase family 2 protein [Chloracidobacterium sp. A]QUV97094.1 glycosyltransferase family 2 protein [Chloracidobacterium sp. E]
MNYQTPDRLLSIVAPCFNEAEGLEAFHTALTTAVASLPYDVEIIYVDDGSTDATPQVLARLRARDARVKTLTFSRNFGHQAALLAGLDAARGAAVITLDSDLQHPPELIPELVRAWEQGADIVYTVRRETADASFGKRLTSRLFYRLLNWGSGTPIIPGAADFRLMSRLAVNSFCAMRETHRFNRGLVSWLGFRTAAVPFDAPARFAGESKYSLTRMLRFAVHGLVSFSVWPLRMATLLGFGMAAFAALYIVYALYVFFVLRWTVPGWTSTLVTVLLIGGVQLISLGLVGEYVGKIYEEVKRRPLYVVRERQGFEGDVGEGGRATAPSAGKHSV